MNLMRTAVLSAVALVAAGAGGYALLHRGVASSGGNLSAAVAVGAAPSGTHITSELISSTSTPPAGYLEYRNEKYGFLFYHSPQAVVKEYDEGGGAMTITEENLQKVRGFQVFIVPYAEPTISEERFKRDVPSGVRTDVENTSVDGVRAVTFRSRDAVLGPTREIWVLRGGYLYEITTFQGVGNWFGPIISSFRFF